MTFNISGGFDWIQTILFEPLVDENQMKKSTYMKIYLCMNNILTIQFIYESVKFQWPGIWILKK